MTKPRLINILCHTNHFKITPIFPDAYIYPLLIISTQYYNLMSALEFCRPPTHSQK
jgi:hypothetical protein